MDVSSYVDNLGRELVALLENGDENSRALVERLASSLNSAVRLTLLEALSAAADEITRDLAPGSVELRLRGREPQFVVTPAPAPQAREEPVAPEEAVPTDDGATTRINLRLPETLKASVEQAAANEGRSVNAWLVRAATNALRQPASRAEVTTPRGSQSYTGWVR